MSKKWKPSAPQTALMEKLYTGGPAPLGPINPKTYAVLDEQGLVQPVSVDGISMVELSAEGVYWMGGEEPA